jgi:hypothetical protein
MIHDTEQAGDIATSSAILLPSPCVPGCLRGRVDSRSIWQWFQKVRNVVRPATSHNFGYSAKPTEQGKTRPGAGVAQIWRKTVRHCHSSITRQANRTLSGTSPVEHRLDISLPFEPARRAAPRASDTNLSVSGQACAARHDPTKHIWIITLTSNYARPLCWVRAASCLEAACGS